MSLLLKDVEQRWQTRLDILQQDTESKMRNAEGRARAAEQELVAGVRRVHQLSQEEVGRYEQKLRESEEREQLTQERAERAVQKAIVASQRADDQVRTERQAAEARILELEAEVVRVTVAADARVAEATKRMREAQERAERAEADAKVRVVESQAQAEREVLTARFQERRGVESARSSCDRQLLDVTDRASRHRGEAQAHLQQVYDHANGRVDLANRRALASQRRARGVAVDGDQCFGHRCGNFECGAGPVRPLTPLVMPQVS